MSARLRLWQLRHSTSGSLNTLDVAGRHPHFGRQNDGSVDTDDIRTGDDHGAPPFALDIVLESDAERAVIPSGTGAAVNFAGGEHEAATLRKGYDFIEFGLSHNAPSGLNGLGSNNNRFRIAVYGDRSGGIVRYMFRVSRATVRSDSYIATPPYCSCCFTLPEFVPLTSRQRHKFGRCCSAEASMYHEWTGTRQT